MKVGKVPEIVLKRSILKQINHRRKEVLVGPAIGEDCAVIELPEEDVLVMSTDPITGTTKDIGIYAVHITVNDLASNGAEVIGIMLTVLLPDGVKESSLKEMMAEIEGECRKLGIEVIGGHTEITTAVIKPIVTVTGVGKMPKNQMITTKGIEAGDEIVMTKWAGLEGTAIIASAKEKELRQRYTQEFIDGAKQFITYLSVLPEAAVARKVGVTSMHDITEGGVFGALWEIASASDVGLDISLKKIPLKQETVELCEFYDLNPYLLISSGCMLISTKKGNELVEQLEKQKIPACIIGRATKGKDRIVRNEEEVRFLEPPKSDELYKVMS